jgi:hypothetical protein
LRKYILTKNKTENTINKGGSLWRKMKLEKQLVSVQVEGQ